jgi:succinate dehydrogenase flavin-adding protein (antitoxin of CptAB toxin-antitoxin module)
VSLGQKKEEEEMKKKEEREKKKMKWACNRGCAGEEEKKERMG